MRLTIVNKTSMTASDFDSILDRVFTEDANSYLVDYLSSKDGVIINVVDKVTDTVDDSDVILFVTYEGEITTELSSEFEMTNELNSIVLVWAVSKTDNHKLTEYILERWGTVEENKGNILTHLNFYTIIV